LSIDRGALLIVAVVTTLLALGTILRSRSARPRPSPSDFGALTVTQQTFPRPKSQSTLQNMDLCLDGRQSWSYSQFKDVMAFTRGGIQ
jgi:hypothetical protein